MAKPGARRCREGKPRTQPSGESVMADSRDGVNNKLLSATSDFRESLQSSRMEGF